MGFSIIFLLYHKRVGETDGVKVNSNITDDQCSRRQLHHMAWCRLMVVVLARRITEEEVEVQFRSDAIKFIGELMPGNRAVVHLL